MTADASSPALCVLWLGEAASGTALPGARIQRASAELPLSWILALAPDLVVCGAARADELAYELAEARRDLCMPIVAIDASAANVSRRGGVVARVDPEGDVASVLASVLADAAARPRLPIGGNYAAALRGRAGLVFASGATVAIDAAGRRAPHVTLEGDLAFSERPPGSLCVLDAPREGGVDQFLQGARIVLWDEGDGSRWQAAVDSLKAAGAHAVVEREIAAAQSLDPSAIVVPESALATPIAEALDTDARLSAASLLVVRGDLDAASVCAAAADLCRSELAIVHRLGASERVLDRIEALGPARWLKVVARSTEPTALELHAAAGIGRIQLTGGKIREATFVSSDAANPIEPGRPAIQAMLAMRYGTVIAGPRDAVAQGRPILEPKVATTPPTRRSGAPKARTSGAPPPIAEEAKSEAPPQEASTPAEEEKTEKKEKAKRPARAKKPAPRPDVSQDETEVGDRAPAPAAAAPAESPPAQAQPAEESSRSAWTWLAIAAALVGIAVVAVWWGGASDPQATGPTAAADPPHEATPATTGAHPMHLPDRPHAPRPAPQVDETRVDETRVDETRVDETQVAEPPVDPQVDETQVADAPPPEPQPADTPPADTPPVEPPPAPIADSPPEVPGDPASRENVTGLLIQLRRTQQERDYAQMRMLAQEVLRLRPENGSAAYYMGLAMLRLPGGSEVGHDEALEWVHRAEQWDPNDSRAWLLEGDIYRQHGRPVSARTAWERCLRVNPDSEACRSRLGEQ